MFRLINSHLQAYSLQVKSQLAVHTLGSQCKRTVIETVVLTCYISITIRIPALRDVFIQNPSTLIVALTNSWNITSRIWHLLNLVHGEASLLLPLLSLLPRVLSYSCYDWYWIRVYFTVYL